MAAYKRIGGLKSPLFREGYFCYNVEIYKSKHIPIHTMSIDACIAHAIHSDLDILQVLPELKGMPVESLEPYIENYILTVQQELRQVIINTGDRYIRAKDAAGLCATCMEAGIGIPPKMLLRMCQTIMQLSTIDARFILDTEDGTSLFYVRMGIDMREPTSKQAA